MINFFQLKYFSDAVRYQSMSRAAELNGVTRPAVSLAILSLEREFAVKLVIHQKRNFLPTAEGLWLAERAEKMSEELTALKKEIKFLAPAPLKPIRISVTHSLARLMIPHFLEFWPTTFPPAAFAFGNSLQIEKMVQNGESDVGLLVATSLVPATATVIKKGHFAIYGENQRRVFVTEARPEVAAALAKLFKHYGPIEVTEVASWDLISDLVLHGHGLGLLPDFILHQQPKALRTLPHLARAYAYQVIMVEQKKSGPQVLPEKRAKMLKIFKSTFH